MISTTGLPVAMSRMISEAQTLGNHAQIRKIYKTALYVFLTIGIVGSLGMFIFSKPLSVLCLLYTSKMRAQNKTIDELYDLYAFRVIVDDIADCYNVLGHIHDLFSPIPGLSLIHI